MTLLYSRATQDHSFRNSPIAESEFIRKNVPTYNNIRSRLEDFDLVMLALLKWEYDNTLGSGIIGAMIIFFDQGKAAWIRFCYGLKYSYSRQPLAKQMKDKDFLVAVRSFCDRLEQYAQCGCDEIQSNDQNLNFG